MPPFFHLKQDLALSRVEDVMVRVKVILKSSRDSERVGDYAFIRFGVDEEIERLGVVLCLFQFLDVAIGSNTGEADDKVIKNHANEENHMDKLYQLVREGRELVVEGIVQVNR